MNIRTVILKQWNMKLYVRGSFNEKKLWAILDFCTWTNLFSPVEAVPYPPCRGFILPDALKNTLKNPLNYFSFKEKNFKVMVSKMRVLV